jgi:tRNA threonylcarbamoyladenosine biosynthesis protein TsaE
MELIYSLTEINSIAKVLANHFKNNIILFYGPMGAGKTTLIKALVKELGSNDNVSSPTFSLVNEYRTIANLPIFHFDFYRINSETEALDMGVEEYFDSDAICLIEWPEKVKNLLHLNAVKVEIFVLDNGNRKIVLS